MDVGRDWECQKVGRRRGNCNCTPWRNLRHQFKNLQILAVTLLVYTALIYACFCRSSSRLGAVDSLLEAAVELPVNCSDPDQIDEHLYKQYVSKHANLKIKLLSEQDGAPPLQSQHSLQGSREITIVTQMSVDRSSQLEKMASGWRGALCVAVHVKRRADIAAVYRKMKLLHEYIEAQRHCRLHVQLVMEEGFKSENDALAALYPVNALRNVALSMATTDLVFLLDSDFLPSPGLHEKLTENEKVYADLVSRAKHEDQLLVVPAFQGFNPNQSLRESRINPVHIPIPRSMDELRERWTNRSVDSFRANRFAAHGPTAYGHFMHPLTKEPYPVQYREFYEPYVIAAREVIPKFDERFRGYGKNKIAYLYNCAVLGFTFVVLPDVYVYEIPHPRTEGFSIFLRENSDKNRENPCQRNIMNAVYDVFKRELQP